MGEDANRRGNSRRWIIRAVEDSLRRLETDYIDLCQVHRPSPDTDVEETLGALTDLVRQARSVTSDPPPFPAAGSSRPSGPPMTGGWNGSCASRRRTRCWCAEVLDRIDEIATPSTVINPADSSFINPALEPTARRR
ncbi:hypothetical protein SSPO_005760 [Streptomyces antimycoticus]|uniref:NADP-dependent oxidoreductase domain-containing protein n=1 Tax=Streptomyces antimycoticus TaxID=68175 RepID=A0A499UEP5_9ACTN|nr:hypothetical protein SSPO_005760 [Streptomyces antimycoticus]